MTRWMRWGPGTLLLVACATPAWATPMTPVDDSTSGGPAGRPSELTTNNPTGMTPLDLTRSYTNTTGLEVDNLTIDFNVVSGSVLFSSATDEPTKTFPSITVTPTSVTFAGAKLLPDQTVKVHVLGSESLPNTISVSMSGAPIQPAGETIPEPVSLLIWGAGTVVAAVAGYGSKNRRPTTWKPGLHRLA